jgi:hypothetical protein
MKLKLLALAGALALSLTGCVGGTFSGYVEASCSPTEAGVTTCTTTQKPIPTETVPVPGPTVTVTEPGPIVTQTVPGPTTTVTVTPSPAPTTASPSPTATTTAAPSTEKRYTAYVTGYSYYDNDPPNSNAIAYESVVPTRTGAGGTGTFTNPTTIAVPDRLPDGQVHAPGDKFYIPNLQKYFIVEDLCAQSHANNYTDCTSHDVWVDGRPYGNTAANNCMNKLTGNYLVIKNPAANYRVATPGTITANCTTYGNTVVTQ